MLTFMQQKTTGQIQTISTLEKGGFEVSIIDANNDVKKQVVPAGLNLLVKEGAKVGSTFNK